MCEPEGRGEGEHYECWALNPLRVRLTYALSGRIRVVAALPDEHFYIEPDEAPEVLVKRWLNALTLVERNA